MNSKILLVTLVLSMLVLNACAGGGNQQDPRGLSFVGGNIGLEVGLVNGLPPATVYDNGKMNFGIGVALHNIGETDVGPGTDNPKVTVRLEGFSPRAFSLTAADMIRDLDQPLMSAKKNFDGSLLPGQITNVVFEPLNYQDKLQGNIIQNMVTTICYDYENWATVPLCFKDEMFEMANDICTLTGEKFPQNSGGPIHVTSLVQNPLGPYKVMANFLVEHVGSGEFYNRDPNEECSPQLNNPNKYKVEVSVESADPGMQIDCSSLSGGNSGTITLFNGAPTAVICTLTAPDSGSRIYSDPVSINIRYRYGESINQPIVVQAVGDQI